MKKTISMTLLVFLCLVMIFSQAFASGPDSLNPKPKHTPGPNETLEVEQEDNEAGKEAKDNKDKKENKGAGKSDKQAGRKYNFKGEVTSFDGGVIVITGKRGGTATVDANTEIKVSGPEGGAAAIQVGQQVMVQAVKVDNGFRALRVHLFPNKPAHTHRVGQVTDYQPGVSITVQDKKGTTTFQIAADVKILPAERVGQLKVGSRVTIISPASVNKDAGHPVAKGIVVHSEKANKSNK